MGLIKVTSENINEHWQRMNDDHRILDDPQFTVSDVRLVTGATAKAIEHMLDPKHSRVQLNGRHVSPGTGKRRMFTGSDILKIQAAYVMSAVGFPQKWSLGLTKEVEKRASLRICGLSDKTGYQIITYPLPDGDWSHVPVYADISLSTPLPISYQTLEVDRLIDETLAKLQAIVLDEEIPDFTVPAPEISPSIHSPENDFFKMWHKDGQGRDVLVALDWAETQEYLHYIDEPTQHSGPKISRERYLKLADRHELARMQRVDDAAKVELAKILDPDDP